MPKRSAGIILFRRTGREPEVLLVHPGGPYWANKDEGAWSIPKGEYQQGEDPLAAAKREFEEETGFRPEGEFLRLAVFAQSKAKTVEAWAVEGDLQPARVKSIDFSMEWPPRSGRLQEFPEVDRADWFGKEEAARKILKGQLPILAALFKRLANDEGMA